MADPLEARAFLLSCLAIEQLDTLVLVTKRWETPHRNNVVVGPVFKPRIEDSFERHIVENNMPIYI